MPAAGELRLDRDDGPRATTLRLGGELDLLTAGKLQAAASAALREGARGIVLDMRQLVFMDSGGLRMLMTVWDECREAEREFFVIPDRGACRRLLEITGAIDELPLLEASELADGRQ